MTRCPCGNTAPFGEDDHWCEEAALLAERQRELTDAVRNAAEDIPDGPMRRFADALVAWIEENGRG